MRNGLLNSGGVGVDAHWQFQCFGSRQDAAFKDGVAVIEVVFVEAPNVRAVVQNANEGFVAHFNVGQGFSKTFATAGIEVIDVVHRAVEAGANDSTNCTLTTRKVASVIAVLHQSFYEKATDAASKLCRT